jgi:hypothetical protein
MPLYEKSGRERMKKRKQNKRPYAPTTNDHRNARVSGSIANDKVIELATIGV